ncbi:Mce protein [Mycolicibacter acidiphilus]|uniref:Mce protein n=1 Tax=Mycolicibacter acidiphilus TaxID=2835306 RepID=UPI0035584A4D
MFDDDRPEPEPAATEAPEDDAEGVGGTPETPETPEAPEPPETPEAAEAPEPLDVPAVVAPPASRRSWLAVAVLALGVIVASYEGWLLYAQHERAVAAAQALEAAERYTLTLTGVNPDDIDKNFAEVLDGATGEFKEMYAKSSEQLRRLLIENRATAHGTVVDAAVSSATKKRVEVLLFVDQAVSNKASPEPQIDRSRIVMTMEKVGGRWLAAKVDMP